MTWRERAWAFARTLLIPITLAILSFTFAYATQNLLFFGNIGDLALDRQMQLDADRIKPGPAANPIVFIDFDDESLQRLGYPALISQDAIADVLDQAARGQPSLIVVDIDTTWSWDSAAVRRLASTLQRIDQVNVPVLLAREPLFGGPTPILRPTPLDDIVARSRNLMWVSVEGAPGGDGIVRRMPLWTVACLASKPAMLPSVNLAAYLVQRAGSVTRANVALQGLGPWAPTCRPGGRTSRMPSYVTLRVDDVDRRILAARGGRVRFTLRWPPRSLDPRTQIARPELSPTPQASAIPAWPLLQKSGAVDAALIDHALVIVGSSSAGRKDLHMTPLGQMPGAFIIANGLRAWREFGPPSDPSFCARAWNKDPLAG